MIKMERILRTKDYNEAATEREGFLICNNFFPCMLDSIDMSCNISGSQMIDRDLLYSNASV